MSILKFALFFSFFISLNSVGDFSKADIRGPESLCEKLKEQKEEGQRTCSYYSDFKEANVIDKLSSDIDEHLALNEIKRQVLIMANTQIANSFRVLDRLGVEKRSVLLDRKINELKNKGYNFPKEDNNEDEGLTDQYLIAALRYHEHKYTLANYSIDKKQKEQMNYRIKLLELRYPLITNFNFKTLKDYMSLSFGNSSMAKLETSEEAKILDSYLLNDTPRELKDIESLGITPKSNTGKNLESLIKNKDRQKIVKIRKALKDDLQNSLALQIDPLENINKFNACQLMNIHSHITLEAINSSANPEKILAKYCACQSEESIIDEDIVIGLEMSSLGGLGLCITPSVVGQVFGCPTAMIAGLAATGASTVNFVDYMARFSKIRESKGLTTFLEMGNLEKNELEFLEEKELATIQNIGLSRLIGLVGFGVGHIGLKGLIRVYKESNISQLLSRLTKNKRDIFEKKIGQLTNEEQTQAFIVLEKLDDDIRNFFVERPDLLLKNIRNKELRCEI